MLSIIIPALNEEKYLPLLLDSIKKQGFKDYEIIVADAESKDKTIEVAKSYGCKVVLGGLLPKGRNEGAKAAKGDILLFLDADMLLKEKFLEKALEEFEKRKLGIAGFPIFTYDGNKFDKLAYGFYNQWMKLTQLFLAHAGGAILVKKDVWEKIGGFDEKILFVEDHPFARAAKKISKYGLIGKEPVFTSARRLEKDGRFKTYIKYILSEAHLILFGPIKSNIFKYKFDHYEKRN